jgi:hypothetical protein
VTLPEHVIDALASLDADIGRAIVRLAQPLLAVRPHAPAQLTTFGRRSLIVVSPSRTLEKRTGIDLLHLPDGRALIAFEQPITIAGLELMIEDALDDPALPDADRETFSALGDILRTARRSGRVGLVQKSVIVLETGRTAATLRRNSKR